MAPSGLQGALGLSPLSKAGQTTPPVLTARSEVQRFIPTQEILLLFPFHQMPAQTVFTLCYPRANDPLSSLTELFLVHLQLHVLPKLEEV